MRNSVVAALAGSALLAGCAGGGGLNRDRPDEFAVARQAPLVIPPDFALVPPTPGAARVQGADPSRQALDALFSAAPRSAVERAALAEAGDDVADTGIRSQVGDAETNVVDKGATTRDIIAAPQGDGQGARAGAGTGTGASAPAPAPTATPTP